MDNRRCLARRCAIGDLCVVAFIFHPAARHCEGRTRLAADTQSIHVAMDFYKGEFGKYPTGDSHAVFQALTGKNPKRIVFVVFRQVSAEGDPLDTWGTPYRIYFSGDEFLVRSAGPNKRFDQGSSKGSDDYIY
ncbi:MAG: type II secretion system protein GspG [Verrucomicrobiia bacterium]